MRDRVAYCRFMAGNVAHAQAKRNAADFVAWVAAKVGEPNQDIDPILPAGCSSAGQVTPNEDNAQSFTRAWGRSGRLQRDSQKPGHRATAKRKEQQRGAMARYMAKPA